MPGPWLAERGEHGRDRRDRRADVGDEVQDEQARRQEERQVHAQEDQEHIGEDGHEQARQCLHHEILLHLPHDALDVLEPARRGREQPPHLRARAGALAEREEHDEEHHPQARRRAGDRDRGPAEERDKDAVCSVRERNSGFTGKPRSVSVTASAPVIEDIRTR